VACLSLVNKFTSLTGNPPPPPILGKPYGPRRGPTVQGYLAYKKTHPPRTLLHVYARGTSLTRKRTPLGPYCRPMPRALRDS